MYSRTKLKVCLVVNGAILLVVVGLIIGLADKSASYWRVGWNPTLTVVSVRIDSGSRYAVLLGLLAAINVARVLVEDLGMPVLGFNIYNPDKRVITEFGRTELQAYGNAMFLLSNVRNVFTTLVLISQIDLALWSVLVSEAATVVSIRILLRDKVFVGGGEPAATSTDSELQMLPLE